jgi:hypothetical protein
MKFLTVVLAAALLACAPSGAALAQKPVISCGDLRGYAIFADESPLGPTPRGWIQDSISPARVVLVSDAKGEPDILIQDAAGYMSYRQEGCSVTSKGLPAVGAGFVVMAICSLSIDVYLFSMKADGTGQVLFSQSKLSARITKGSTMVANCRRD